MIYKIRITLTNIEQVVSRTLLVEAEATFEELHKLIQLSFDWWDYHSHHFQVKTSDENRSDEVLILPTDGKSLSKKGNFSTYDEASERLADWLLQTGEQLFYTYDVKNNWLHEIVLLEKLAKDKTRKYPACVQAINKAPPEESRFEVSFGLIELHTSDSDALVDFINEAIGKYYIHPIMQRNKDVERKYWNELLSMSKKLYKIKPWQIISDKQIFVIYHKKSKQYSFCRVLGENNKWKGLAVYIGYYGLRDLYNNLKQSVTDPLEFEQQSQLLLNFEQKLEDDLLQQHPTSTDNTNDEDVWPLFTSYKLGYYPWVIDVDEAKLLIEGMEATIQLCEKMKNGLQIPKFNQQNHCMYFYPLRATSNEDKKVKFLSIDRMLQTTSPIKLEISEIELKRVLKRKIIRNTIIEFSMKYIYIPIQRIKGLRPFFPLTTVIADHVNKSVIYHNVYDHHLNSKVIQTEFIQMIDRIRGIPSRILVDDFTYEFLAPLVEKLNIQVEIKQELPVVDEVITNMSHYLKAKI